MGLENLKAIFGQEGNEQEETKSDKPKVEKQDTRELILSSSIERDRKAAETYKRMADNIKQSEKLRAKINKSIKNNIPRDKILEDCIECIYLMTGDKASYRQNIEILGDRG